MNHEKIENLNRLIMSKKIKPVIQDLPKKKNQGPDGFAGEFYSQASVAAHVGSLVVARRL